MQFAAQKCIIKTEERKEAIQARGKIDFYMRFVSMGNIMKKTNIWKKLLLVLSVILLIVAATVTVTQKGTATVNSNMSIAALKGNKPLYAAHRGLSSLAPQNTVPAFELAAKTGYYAYEFDVHTSADGRWVVIHNDTVDDMTDSTGNVEDFTLEQLKNMNIDSGKQIKNYPNLKIPTLQEALAVCKNYDIVPIIELKKIDVMLLPEFFEILKDYNLLDRAVLISFNFDYLKEAQKYCGTMKMMYLLHSVTKEDVDLCAENGNIGIDFNYKKYFSSKKAIAYAKEKGLALGAWTVDNTIASDRMVAAGVTLITTNRIIP